MNSQFDQIRVLALDLDDTLLRVDNTLAASTHALLAEWQARGNRTVIATGRPPRSTGESLPADLWQVPWACYNGAVVVLNGATIYKDLLPTDDARRIVESLQDSLPDAALGLEIDDVLYMNRPWNRPYPYEIADLLAMADRPVAKVLFFHDDLQRLNGLFTDLPDTAQVMISEKYRLVQILSSSADKASALRHLVAQWDLGMHNVMAFGDDVNDLRMIQESGIGVAVENAVPEVKAVADRITLSNDAGGVDVVLAELLKVQ
jgi:Cof subfamily protein (haloacid dehalogenase superfamily)